MFARMHTLGTNEAQYEEGLRILREELLPWARESSGFRGVVALTDRERTKTVVLSFWADKQALDESAAAGERLSSLAAAVAGAERLDLEDFEVGVLELDPDSAG